MSLDFAKAFDSCDWQLAIPLMIKAGLPSKIALCVQAMWASQKRWFSFGHCIAKNPLTNICALPQGDPWAPCAMALMLAPAIRKISEEIPDVFQVTYMDDRTALFRSTHKT